MPKKPADVTETELSILDVLWSRGPAEIRDIVERVYGSHTPALHATVNSLLDRLDQKGYVDCDRSRHRHRYSATIPREKFVGAQLQKLADAHFDGSVTPMLMTLIERTKLSRADRDAIRKIIKGINRD